MAGASNDNNPYVPCTLVIDNYDSYTYNLVQLLRAQAKGSEAVAQQKVVVVRNDQYTWKQLQQQILPNIDNIVISPGPGRPDCGADFGVCKALISHNHGIPILGVCLGHQGIAAAFGAQIVPCAAPVHGQISQIEIYNDPTAAATTTGGILAGMENGFRAVRYHSLTVSDDGFPHDQLAVLARATGDVQHFREGRLESIESREIMALCHRTRPLYGVQFHPESVCSEYGALLLQNFARLTCELYPVPRAAAGSFQRLPPELSVSTYAHKRASADGRFELVADVVDLPGMDAAQLGEQLQRLLHGDDPMPLWLDSATGENMTVLASATNAVTVRYDVHTRLVTVVRISETAATTVLHAERLLEASNDTVPFWAWMQNIVDNTQLQQNSSQTGVPFQCGWIGHFGYGMAGRESYSQNAAVQQPLLSQQQPDAQLTFVDRCVVIDHSSHPPRAHILALVQRQRNPDSSWLDTLGFADAQQAHAWVQKQTRRIRQSIPSLGRQSEADISISNEHLLPLHPRTTRSRYLQAIAAAKQYIIRGESYEVCLTTQFEASTDGPRSATEMRALYLRMRRRSPAPFGALLWYADRQIGIASCSPERFLHTRTESDAAVHVQMKPIKGTIGRQPQPSAGPCAIHQHTHASRCWQCLEQWKSDDDCRIRQLRESVKERAENLMIVDLIRHDLGALAAGAVQVPRLIDVESFARVHQLVTTVDCRLRSDVGCVDALARCFPPGSMTGAPKRRTVQIIAELERQADKDALRGAYSGVVGYFSASAGSADFAVIIRTAVVEGGRVRVGAGGAITILSDPAAEWAEVETKAGSISGAELLL
ncbi:para-aminobenzoate synthase, (PABA) [Coemansia guatemalensis]|uniref:aminodeoxychorismate synthase n=1 Tax=Coemansia guatemalensis TaxID=2761395 RepID=A0A9W8I3Q7_9FUNG|nr:para-aminobenzoate synthase, (PABA) [Coemansia guatemalensis]